MVENFPSRPPFFGTIWGAFKTLFWDFPVLFVFAYIALAPMKFVSQWLGSQPMFMTLPAAVVPWILGFALSGGFSLPVYFRVVRRAQKKSAGVVEVCKRSASFFLLCCVAGLGFWSLIVLPSTFLYLVLQFLLSIYEGALTSLISIIFFLSMFLTVFFSFRFTYVFVAIPMENLGILDGYKRSAALMRGQELYLVLLFGLLVVLVVVSSIAFAVLANLSGPIFEPIFLPGGSLNQIFVSFAGTVFNALLLVLFAQFFVHRQRFLDGDELSASHD